MLKIISSSKFKNISNNYEKESKVIAILNVVEIKNHPPVTKNQFKSDAIRFSKF